METKDKGLGIDWPNGKPKGPGNTTIKYDAYQWKWFPFFIGWTFATCFWSLCAHLWGG